jgi:hypothetical protein
MRVLIVAMAIALTTVPAFPQAGAINGPQSAGRAARPQEPKVDTEKKKADEKAYSDGVSRIPPSEKKYDPWGSVRPSGK